MSGPVLGAMDTNMKTPALLLMSSDICRYFVFVGCAALKYGWPGFESQLHPNSHELYDRFLNLQILVSPHEDNTNFYLICCE